MCEESEKFYALPKEPPPKGRFPCPCCGYLTYPTPKEYAVAYICPVCFWENDVFTSDEDELSMKKLVHVRKPRPEEIPKEKIK